ncbi:MAG: small conductance mechanosensitive channel [Planctomycetota bacterium]|jgi:small conductance mechanosensitive channel
MLQTLSLRRLALLALWFVSFALGPASSTALAFQGEGEEVAREEPIIQDVEPAEPEPENGVVGASEALSNAAQQAMDNPVGFVEDWVNKGKDWATDKGPGILGKLALFLVIIMVSRIAGRIASNILGRTMRSQRVNAPSMLTDFAVGMARKVVGFIGILFAMVSVGIDIGPFLAAFGVVGFVVGFALQDTMSNFASGVMLLLYRPFDLGNVVEVSGVKGSVESMSIVSTTLKTPDNQTIVVPNSSVWGNTITNITSNPTRRVDLSVGISYDDDIELAEKVLDKILADHELVLQDPEPVAKLNELGDSSVNFVVRAWVKTGDWGSVRWDLLRSFKVEFDKAGLNMPYPQQDVHLHGLEKGA